MTVCDSSGPVAIVSIVIPLIISLCSYFFLWRKKFNETKVQKFLAVALALAVLFIFVILGAYISIEFGLGCLNVGDVII